MKRWMLLLLVLLLALASMVQAQEEVAVQNETTQTVDITWPPPVTEVWGTGDVLGTAAVPGMAYYYLDYIALNEDLSIPTNAPWLPATIGITKPVVNGSLATLDTTTVPDGIYALRLTVSTLDGQYYHDIVTPIRVDNERFNAIFGTSSAVQLPELPPTQAPTDTTPRVVTSAQYSAINVRRCDLVDNQRCPVIGSLQSGEAGIVQAISSNNTGWFQIKLPSGVVGWVSPTVVSQQGDFSGVGRTQPPAPLAVAVQLPSMSPVGQVSSVVPNGLAIEGGSASCGITFNVQINVANTGNSVTPAGNLTLQDVNIRTGEVTFTGYGSYPSLNPGANFVIVVPALTSVYYNEDHELRVFTNGRELHTRYSLQPGNCAQVSAPQLPAPTQRSFAPGECTIVLNTEGEVYDRPDGEVVTIFGAGTYPALQVVRVGGLSWYEINFADASSWIPSNIVATQGNCGL